MDVKVLICITTYGRFKYLKKLIESIERTAIYDYDIVIHDDGSEDGTIEYIESKGYTLLKSDNIGTHSAKNYLFMYARKKEYDIGFMMDDDLYFEKRGWDKLYYETCRDTGYWHLSHFNTNWEERRGRNYGNLTTYGSAIESQGALYTFTKEVLEDVGYIDRKNFGFRGEGHRDWTVRACRMGYNDEYTLYDARNANNYITLHSKENYIKTKDYLSHVLRERRRKGKKVSTAKSRRGDMYIDIWPSPINFFFDHVYCVNLERRKDRRKYMRSLFEKYGISASFIRAIDGENSKLVDRMYKRSSNVTKPEIGCHLSHKYIYEDAMRKGYETICIFEDDVIPHKDLNNILLNVFDVPDWTILYLGASDWYWKDNKEAWDGGVYYKGSKINATHAYAMNREGIKKALDLFNEPIVRPCDTTLHQMHDIYDCYVLKPHAFIQDITESDIRHSRSYNEVANRFDWNIHDYIM